MLCMRMENLERILASVIHTRIINYIVNYSLENKIEDKHLNRIKLLLNEEDLFTNDYKFNIAKKVVAGNKVKFAKLIMDKEYSTNGISIIVKRAGNWPKNLFK